MHYLDTSVILSVLLPDSHTTAAQAYIQQNAPLVVSDWVEVELEGVLNRFARDPRFTPAHLSTARTAWLQLAQHPSVSRAPIGRPTFTGALQLLRSGHPLSSSDAIHLALAQGRNLTLVTADAQLHRAANAANVSAHLIL